MLVRRQENIVVVRLEKGEKIIESVAEVARSEAINGAFFYGLGGVMWAELGFYNLSEQEYSFMRIDELMELTNITGNIAMLNDEVSVHAHATLGKSDYSTAGGHLKEAEVAGTVEIFISLSGELNRSINDEIGLNLLDL